MKNILLLSLLVYLFTGCSNKTLYQKFQNIAKKYNVNHKTLIAICKVESNLNPNVVNVNKSIFNIQKGSHYFSSAFTANLYMDFVLDPLLLNYDIGICQVNKMHLSRFSLDNEDLLDEDTNIDAAAKIYNYNVRKCGGKLMCALSMYNTGYKHSKIGYAYARKVIKKRKQLFGK